jgi:RecB family endonuclease NucS
LESREGLRASQYGEALRIMRATCSVFDYSTRESQVLGSEGERLYIGRRSDTYFVLTEKEYERASSNSSVLGSRKQV